MDALKLDEKALALKAAGLTSPDGTFVHGPTREVIAALSAPPATTIPTLKEMIDSHVAVSEEAQALANFDRIADAHFASVETGLSNKGGGNVPG